MARHHRRVRLAVRLAAPRFVAGAFVRAADVTARTLRFGFVFGATAADAATADASDCLLAAEVERAAVARATAFLAAPTASG
jgi:hypothetical protein